MYIHFHVYLLLILFTTQCSDESTKFENANRKKIGTNNKSSPSASGTTNKSNPGTSNDQIEKEGTNNTANGTTANTENLSAYPANIQPQGWQFKSHKLSGEQVDAVAGFDGKVHAVTTSYFQLSPTGDILLTEKAGDETQDILWALKFAPAISVGKDNSVHIVSRFATAGSNHDGYYALKYQKRSADGQWTTPVQYAGPNKWNWNVGVATDGNGRAFGFASNLTNDNVWSDINIFDLTQSPQKSGAIKNHYRVDFEARMRGGNGSIFYSSSNVFIDSKVYVAWSNPNSANIFNDFSSNNRTFASGSGKAKGFPDLALDRKNNLHLTYGSGYTNHSTFPGGTSGSVQGEVHYNKLNAQGAPLFSQDKTLFTNLGLWHLSTGLSAVAVSDNGQIVVAVALKSPNHKEAGNSELLWCYSINGGETFSQPQTMGALAFGGEGRQRPRLVAIGKQFVLFYKKQSSIGVSIATLDFQ